MSRLRLRILDLYTLREFLGPFLFCVMGFTVILLSGLLFELADLIFVKNVPTATVSEMLLYKVPGMVAMTLPIAVLFSTLLALGGLNQNSELIVMRASGLAFRRIIVVFLLAGFVVSGLTYLLNEEVVPWSNHQFQTILRRIIFEDGAPVVEENVFFRGGPGQYFYIHEVDPSRRELQDVMVYELQDDTTFPRLITARRGHFEDYLWFLYDGLLQELDEAGSVRFESRFEQMTLHTEQEATAFFGTQKTTDEMNRQELAGHIERFQRGGLRVRSFVVDYHLKLAMPMSSLIFALFASPLGLVSRGGSSFGVAVSIVVTFLYYVATSVSRSLGVNGILPPALAAWLTNSLFALIGTILLLRSDRLR